MKALLCLVYSSDTGGGGGKKKQIERRRRGQNNLSTVVVVVLLFVIVLTEFISLIEVVINIKFKPNQVKKKKVCTPERLMLMLMLMMMQERVYACMYPPQRGDIQHEFKYS